MAKQSRVQTKKKPKHRAVKVRAARPLDAPKPDNHEARSAARRAMWAEAAAGFEDLANQFEARERAGRIEAENMVGVWHENQ